MTQLSKTAFETKYNDSGTGLFKTGQSRGIGSDDVRDLVTDIKDSFGNNVDNGILSVQVTLGFTGILSSFTTPMTILAAPGAGKMILPLMLAAKLDYGSITYVTNTTILFFYDNTSDNPVTDQYDFLGNGDDALGVFPILNSGGLSVDTSFGNTLINRAIKMKTIDGNPANGNSNLIVEMVYRIITFP
jgi:hypothetical protein